MRRVVVTGIGIVAPTGNDVRSAWSGVLSGKSFIRSIQNFDASQLPVTIAGEVDNFDASGLLGAKVARQSSRFVQLAAVAADEALRDAGFDREEMGRQCGCLIGVGIGGLGEIEASSCLLAERGASRVSPLTLPYAIPNMASGFVAIEHNLLGPSFGLATACASGSHAIGESARIIGDGDAEMMVAGGAEAATCSLSIACFAKMKALSTQNTSPETASRPFDKNRDGFVIGEGAGLLVLEELQHAQRRGATIYAEVVGYGLSADANHLTQPAPEGEGLARAMTRAIKRAEIAPEDIDYINAHGTSTKANDFLESQAIASVFGEASTEVSISSTKGATGHCLGAAGGIEAVYTVLAIRHDVVPPTANLETPDPDCPLNYTALEPMTKPVSHAMSNSSGFGGQNASLIFRKFAH
ncbi:beta-ketoacyl-ACP synthase II [Roseiconus lacunae]|uniref:3-oxoacyl-[acyl-carrier-protein] synthase 2 n=1 Tax=Roseiconus lacunae TaxID=2605694 RepID=A0ABT7PPT7_9BACT|nr:beta-ketoacyl-ACP synthase II [Roseiconus lacunae]MDM4018341.1 beta-ketoacyl-ACP synthase II [Roseiconus lacunae]